MKTWKFEILQDWFELDSCTLNVILIKLDSSSTQKFDPCQIFYLILITFLWIDSVWFYSNQNLCMIWISSIFHKSCLIWFKSNFQHDLNQIILPKNPVTSGQFDSNNFLFVIRIRRFVIRITYSLIRINWHVFQNLGISFISLHFCLFYSNRIFLDSNLTTFFQTFCVLHLKHI